MQSHPVLIALFFCVLIAAAIYDFRTYTIPHGYTYAVLALFALALAINPISIASIGLHVLAGVIAFVAALALYIFGLMGGGDVKLFGAIGMWFLPSGLLGLILCVTLSGALISLIYWIYVSLKNLPQKAKWSDWKSSALSAKSTKLAYGPAISIGTLIYYVLST